MIRSRLLPLLLGFLYFVPLTAAAEAGRIRVHVRSAATDEVGVKLLNGALNQISPSAVLMKVDAKNVAKGIVVLETKGLLHPSQVEFINSLAVDGKPIPLDALYLAMKGENGRFFDRIADKKSLEAQFGFADRLSGTVKSAKAGDYEETFIPLPNGETARKRIYFSGNNHSPDFEHWLVTGRNGFLQEYFFSADGKRQTELPAGVGREHPELRQLGAGFVSERIKQLEAELKRDPVTAKVIEPELRKWRALLAADEQARRKSGAADSETTRKYLLQIRARHAQPQVGAPLKSAPTHN